MIKGDYSVENSNCMICNAIAKNYRFHDDSHKLFCNCPVCGRYEYYPFGKSFSEFNLNHLASYMVYNGFLSDGIENRYFTTIKKEWCEKFIQELSSKNALEDRPVHLSGEDVENWYPKSFSEKLDLILLYLNKHSKYVGEEMNLQKEALISILFVERYKTEKQTDRIIETQALYMMRCLKEMGYIKFEELSNGVYNWPITLTSKAYERIDEIQKKISIGKEAFVAMQFGENTKKLREEIRKGIQGAGYKAVFIDEVEHNNFITPEILKYIKNSKFVVVDLTHQNSGAYFEEGYGMGLGKPVIQLCKKDIKLHFDIAQKNTIMWEKEEDIVEKLKNRILATIED